MPVSKRLLSPLQDELIRDVRGTLQDLRATLVRAGAEPADEQTLQAAARQLDDFFLLVVVGEFNAGKSALVNALLGDRVLTEGVTPTTTQVQLLRHADSPAQPIDTEVRVVTAGTPLLRDMHLVDTPGTNAITREHEVITRRFVPRADLILFVVSADRPLTESERQFLHQLREWGKKIVIAVNKADLLTPQELETVTSFVRENVTTLLGFVPELFTVSARRAFDAKLADDQDALRASGFPALEHYVMATLTEGERFRLKLLNPIGIGLRLGAEYLPRIDGRLQLLRDDTETVAGIRSSLEGFRTEMRRGFDLRLSEIDTLLHAFERRGDTFFDETVRAGRLFDLMNRSRIRLEFEQQVIRDLPKQLEQRVDALIDWLIASDLQQWVDVRDRLSRRRSEHADRVVGRLAGSFDYDRARLLETVGKSAQQTLDAHDHRAEAARMAESVRMAVTNAALFEAGAVGLGTAVGLLATSTAADVTGILAAGVLATIGFVVIPHRRKTARRELHVRLENLRQQLVGALTTQFETELDRSVRRVEEGIGPYVQFVEGERQTLASRQQELAALTTRLSTIKKRIDET